MPTKNKKIIVANWKMNPISFQEAQKILKNTIKSVKISKKSEVVFCVPFVWLEKIGRLLKNKQGYSLGAQDAFWESESGAFTGEISPIMLKNLGVQYVILGHSERRRWLKESNEMINKKVKSSLEAGLKVVLCVGEWDRQDANYVDFVIDQLKSAIEGLSVRDLNNLVVAYEPVWAIGSGLSDTPDNAMSMAILIKKTISNKFSKKRPIKVKVLYGGSVNHENAHKFLKQESIDGALVGRASLDPKSFAEIVELL